MSGSLPYYSMDNSDDVFEENDKSKNTSSIKKRYDKFRDMQHDYIDGHDQSEQIIGTVIAIGSLITEHIICHPFIVLRRQCQVNVEARKLHINPLTLITPTTNIIKTQGVCSLWKGVTSCFVLSGMSLFTENVLSEITGYPKDVDFSKDSSGRILRHLILKSMTFAVLTPFYATNLIETIQSSIVCDQSNILDFFKESLQRIFRSISQLLPNSSRFGSHMIPSNAYTSMLKLMGLTVSYGMVHYLLARFLETLALRAWVRIRSRSHKKYQGRLDIWEDEEIDEGFVKIAAATPYQTSGIYADAMGLPLLAANTIGRVSAEILAYPLETVLNRARCFGSRVLIDDLDSGLRVIVPVPISEPCSVLRSYYAGFGALLLQTGVQLALLRLTQKLLRLGVGMCASPHSRDQFPMVPPRLDYGDENSPGKTYGYGAYSKDREESESPTPSDIGNLETAIKRHN